MSDRESLRIWFAGLYMAIGLVGVMALPLAWQWPALLWTGAAIQQFCTAFADVWTGRPHR